MGGFLDFAQALVLGGLLENRERKGRLSPVHFTHVTVHNFLTCAKKLPIHAHWMEERKVRRKSFAHPIARSNPSDRDLTRK